MELRYVVLSKYKIHWTEVGKIQDVRMRLRVAHSLVAAEILGGGVLLGCI